jgi:hypothetical protein
VLNYDTWFDVQWVIFRDGITPPDLGNISMYEYVGCYAEDTDGSRALTGGTFADEDAMTNEECAIDCAGSVYFGTEYFYQVCPLSLLNLYCYLKTGLWSSLRLWRYIFTTRPLKIYCQLVLTSWTVLLW